MMMTQQEMNTTLHCIINRFREITDPKYKHANIETLTEDYEQLMGMREFQKGNPDYDNIVNAISQTIARMHAKHGNGWRTVSERGINKAIPPVVRKRNVAFEFPFSWVDRRKGTSCSIDKGYWGARNYMVMDIIGYFLLLKEGGDSLPKQSQPIFQDMNSITTRELARVPDDKTTLSVQTMSDTDIQSIRGSRYWIQFDDREFRKVTGLKLNTNQIRELFLETSRVEFKLLFPVRMWNEKKAREQAYTMNFFSRLFEFGYVDEETRNDGVVQNRRYYIAFNTVLGELFAHNLLSMNYDWLDTAFYQLPFNAQIFYRRFIIHNNYPVINLNMDTITEGLNLTDTNRTNLTATIQTNILQPLIEHGLITSYEKTKNGLYGLKFIIKRTKK